jgi:hypothetical protein
MPVEVGEVEVVARPAEGADTAARSEAAAPAPPASDIERSLALRETRDLRLRAD